MKKVLSGFIVLGALGFAASSRAACDLPVASAGFGTATSFAVNSTISSTSTNVNVNCGAGNVLSLLSSNNISLRLASASNVSGTRGTMKRAGDTGTDNIPVQLCTTSACSTEMTIGATAISYTSNQLLNLIGLLGGLNFSIPVYLRTVPGQVVAAGTYSVTLNVAVTYRICTGLAIGGLLCLAGQDQNGSGTVPITVTMTVTNDCTTITAPNISFGSAPLVSSFSTVSQTISVVCTKGSSYTVGLSNGSNSANGVRNMISSAGNRLSYDIYKGSSTTSRWGPSGSERVNSTDSSPIAGDGTTRIFSYTAKVLTTQNTPVAGSYSDNVVVDLSF